ncbi:MAG: amino acid ABC transporter permease [Brachybacterium sp.]|nr:amino acid ABC transporter permease [Brachybacterium sp.]
MSAGATRVLFDAPGPRGRLRIRVISLISVVLLALAAAAALWQFGRNGQLAPERWTPFAQVSYIRYLWVGFQGTMTATALAAVVAFPFGLLLALGRYVQIPVLSWVVTGWIEFFRAIPMLLVIYFFLLLVPTLYYQATGSPLLLPPLWMLVVPMILVSSATTAEIFRAGIKAVDRGQDEAARALGLTRAQSLRHVVIPQAVRLVLPALILALVSLLKDSTLGFIVGYNELQNQGSNLVASTRFMIQTYLIVAAIYVVVNFLLTQLAQLLDSTLQRRAAGVPSSARAT